MSTHSPRPPFICAYSLRFLADHGDHVVVTRSRSGNGGGLIMLGRSDGVLFVLDILSACTANY